MDPYPLDGSVHLMDPYPLDGSVSTWWIRIHLMDPYPLDGSVSPWWIRIHFKDRISLMDPYPFDGSVSTWWIRIHLNPFHFVFFSDTQTADRLMERHADRQTGWLCKFQKNVPCPPYIFHFVVLRLVLILQNWPENVIKIIKCVPSSTFSFFHN